jgi:hemolysin activation/secretion protein
MQPALGGSEDLRGYRPYRFRGDNMLVMNAEYRWEVFSGLDMAVFADAGKVAMKKSDLIATNLETSVGFGLRFHERDKTFLRIDVGFSHEGFQVWVKFTDVFKRGPVHTSSSLGAY